jgi:HlyD family secretion protein
MSISKRAWKLLAGGGAAVALGALVGVRALASNAPAPAQEPPVSDVVGPGLVEGVTKVVELGFEQPGRIATILVSEGSYVQQGEVLARLDARVLEARAERALAAMRIADAHREAAENGARPEEIAEARAELEAARAQAENTARDRARNEALLPGGAVAPKDVDHARAAANTSSARERVALARLAALRSGARSELKRAAVEEVHAAEADLAEARALLAQTELRAPIAGVVVRRYAEPGEQVSTTPPRPVVAVADVSRLRLRAEIDEQDVTRVTLGSEGYAQAPAYGERRFGGRIVQVMPILGRKLVRNDDPLARSDVRVLEVLFELAPGTELPLGLRMDLHVISSAVVPQS